MKLSKKDKQELRKSVEVLLNASPDNKKIQLSNETLDQLLFDTYVVNKEKGIKVKLPVWSGDFLRKLDLSRVSFEDVSWGMLTDIYENIGLHGELAISDDLYKKICNEISPVKKGNYFVCYANTNAKIKLSKSFEAKYRKNNGIIIWDCDFSNIDLFDNELISSGKSFNISKSDCSNTGIIFPNDFVGLYVEDSNLSNNDLSNLELNAIEVIDEISFDNTNLSNTGARIILDIDKLKESTFEEFYDAEYYQRELKEYMEKYWVGCYVNGKLIKSPEEKKQSAEAVRGEYEQYKNQEFANILGSIAEQMDSSGPKK